MTETEATRVAIGLVHMMTRVAEALSAISVAQSEMARALSRIDAGAPPDPAAADRQRDLLSAAQGTIRNLAKEIESLIDLLEMEHRG
ncbi:MAG: hypothetical protein SNJ73_09225 [Acetobacteraceae bacterium]